MTGTVIIGAGLAGATTARTLREVGYGKPITLIGRESHPPYDRPPLSKALLHSEDIKPVDIHLDDGGARQLSIDLRLNAEVGEICRDRCVVKLLSGEEVAYENVVIATGGEAKRWRFDGEASPLILRDFEDALRIRQILNTSSSIAVIGGGWLGLEVAAAARKIGLQTTVLEASNRLCSRAAPRVISDHLLDLHTVEGVDIVLNASVHDIIPLQDGVNLRYAHGQSSRVDAVVVAIGLKPNEQLAIACGLDVEDGIIVDPCGRTQDPAIFAVGDCARVVDSKLGTKVRLESWQNAQVQGRIVATQITGTSEPKESPPWFWSDQFEHNIQILGNTMDEMDVFERKQAGKDGVSYLFCVDNELKGIASVDRGRDVSMARRLMQSPTKIDLKKACIGGMDLRKAVL